LIQIFFATPHHGVDVGVWEKFVEQIVFHTRPENSRPGTGIPSGLLHQIKKNSSMLLKVSQDFRHIQDIAIVSFWEENIYRESGDVVSITWILHVRAKVLS
jgi:hypothetical protein